MGRVYESIGNYDKALEYHKKSLKLNDEIGNKQRKGYSYNNIGMVYRGIGDNKKALEYFQKSIIIKREINDKSGIASTYNYIGLIFQYEGDYNKALDYFLKALTLKKEITNKLGVAESYKNLGFIYTELINYDKAMECFRKSNAISIPLLLKNIEAQNYQGLGELYFAQNKPKESYRYAKKSYTIANNIGNIGLISKSAENLAKSCEALGLFKQGYNYYNIFKTMNDSLINKEIIEKITGIEHQIRNQKEKQAIELEQQKKDAIRDKKEKQQKITRNFLIAGSVLMLLLIMAILRSFWQKRKANLSLIEQNYKIEEQKSIIENKNRHITDSINYAQHIQKSAFLSEVEIKKHLLLISLQSSNNFQGV